MKRKLYQTPQIKICMLNLRAILQGASNLDFDPEDGTDEALSKQDYGMGVWGDDEDEDYE